MLISWSRLLGVRSSGIGGRKRDIVFHGDVMNTTSRLEQVARELDRRLVVSDDAIGRLAGAEHYLLEDLGTRVLRGRTSPVQIYAVTSPVGARERVHAS